MTKTKGTRTIGKRGNLDVSALLQEGVIVTAALGRWRGEAPLVFADLCMEGLESEIAASYLKLGKKSLLDPAIQNKLNTVESVSRYALKRFSLDTPFGLFVTAAAYPELEKVMDGFEQKWMEGRDELVKHIQEHEKDIAATYRKLAREIFKLMKHSRGEVREKVNFASNYAQRILKAMPTATEVFNSFHFSFQAFKVPIPEVLDEHVKANLLNDAKVKAKLNTINKKELQVQEMNHRISQRFEKHKEEQIDRFLTGVNQQVRGKVFDAVSRALHTIDKHNKLKEGLQGRTVSQLHGMIKSFRMLNILNDVEVEKAINQLEEELGKGRTKRNLDNITGILGEIKSISEIQELNLNYIGRSPRGEIVADHDAPEGIELATSHRRRGSGLELAAEEIEAP